MHEYPRLFEKIIKDISLNNLIIKNNAVNLVIFLFCMHTYTYIYIHVS